MSIHNIGIYCFSLMCWALFCKLSRMYVWSSDEVGENVCEVSWDRDIVSKK